MWEVFFSGSSFWGQWQWKPCTLTNGAAGGWGTFSTVSFWASDLFKFGSVAGCFPFSAETRRCWSGGITSLSSILLFTMSIVSSSATSVLPQVQINPGAPHASETRSRDSRGARRVQHSTVRCQPASSWRPPLALVGSSR